jgi:hypothetical protein
MWSRKCRSHKKHRKPRSYCHRRRCQSSRFGRTLESSNGSNLQDIYSLAHTPCRLVSSRYPFTMTSKQELLSNIPWRRSDSPGTKMTGTSSTCPAPEEATTAYHSARYRCSAGGGTKAVGRRSGCSGCTGRGFGTDPTRRGGTKESRSNDL